MNILLEDLNWRYAAKKFDPTKKVSEKDLNTILEAIRLTPSSYGLQPYHVLVITDESIRKQLQPAYGISPKSWMLPMYWYLHPNQNSIVNS